jgi:GxxExxY protein
MQENELTELIIGCAIKVHSALGPGLLESSYEACLFYELNKLGLKVERQKSLPLIYEEIKLDVGYKIDLLVEDKVIVELKTIEEFNDVHIAQLLTYLKLNNNKIGLLINFNVPLLKNGIKRLINKFYKDLNYVSINSQKPL